MTILSIAALALYREPEGGPNRHGSLRRITFSGAGVARPGHEVRLIPAQYVKPYVKTNKSDSIDADAIAEAVGRPTMRFVPVKSDDELDLNPECIGNYWIVVVDSPPHWYNARSSPRWTRNHSLPDSWLAGAEFPTCRLPSQLLRRSEQTFPRWPNIEPCPNQELA